MKKILLLLFLNLTVSFLGGMESDFSQAVRIKTFDGCITSMPLEFVRYSYTLFLRLYQYRSYEHTLPSGKGIDLVHIEYLKNLFSMIDQNKDDEETTLLNKLRKHYNQQCFDKSDKYALEELIKNLSVNIPGRCDILGKMFNYVKIESEDGSKSCYVNPELCARSDTFSTVVALDGKINPYELLDTGIQLRLFDGTCLLLSGDINKTDNIPQILECLCTNNFFGFNENIDPYIARILLLITTKIHEQKAEALCEQFNYLHNPDSYCKELATTILQKLKDTAAVTPMTMEMQTMFEERKQECDNDKISISLSGGEYYDSQEKSITIKRKYDDKMLIDSSPYGGEPIYCSPDKRFLFFKAPMQLGMIINIDLNKKYQLQRSKFGYSMFSAPYFSPDSTFVMVSLSNGVVQNRCVPNQELVIMNLNNGVELKRIGGFTMSECQFSKNSKYIKIRGSDNQLVLINLQLLNALTLEEGILALYDQEK